MTDIDTRSQVRIRAARQRQSKWVQQLRRRKQYWTQQVLLIVDHQLGLLQLVKDYTTAEFRNNVFAHAELGKLFDLPVIMTTSAEQGMEDYSSITAQLTDILQDPMDRYPRR